MGCAEGTVLGEIVGILLGAGDGAREGFCDGKVEGESLGRGDGARVGLVGLSVGDGEGLVVGFGVGAA